MSEEKELKGWGSQTTAAADQTDDWWDPAAPFWSMTPPVNKTEYRILRAEKKPVPGSPGFLVQWLVYQRFTSKSARDAAITKMNKEHPKWRLKASEGNPYIEALGYGGPLPVSGINK